MKTKIKRFPSKVFKLFMSLFVGLGLFGNVLPIYAANQTARLIFPHGYGEGMSEADRQEWTVRIDAPPEYQLISGTDTHFIMKMNENVVYCIEPFVVGLPNGDRDGQSPRPPGWGQSGETQTDTDYAEFSLAEAASHMRYETTPEQIKEVALIAAIGKIGTNGWETIEQSAETYPRHWATQILIWEAVGAGVVPISGRYSDSIQKEYDDIKARVAAYKKTVSFGGQTVELDGFGEGSAKVVSDTSGAFQYYTFNSSSNGVHYSQEGNNLKVWLDEGVTNGSITFDAVEDGTEDDSGVVYKKEGKQGLAYVSSAAKKQITLNVKATVGELSVEKQDVETGEDSQGLAKLDKATYDVVREDTGETVGTLTYENGQSNVIKNLPIKSDGQLITYRLTETSAPTGYHTGVFVDGVLQPTLEITFDPNNQQNGIVKVNAVAKDQTTTTKIRKVDSNGDPVKGATLVVLDKETNKKIAFNYNEEETNDKKEWVSNGNELTVKGLEIGKTYVLQEIHAPNGVMMSEDIEFTIDDATEIQEVTMIDKTDLPVMPNIGTTATVDGKKEVSPSKKVTITDVVEYSKMDEYIGKEVLLEGQLMDKKTGEALAVEGAKAEKTFTPEKAEGTVEMTFIIDASALGGHDVVVYEYGYTKNNRSGEWEDEPIVSHKDINDEGQTVSFKEELTIKTLATVNGEHKFSPNGEVTLTDKVGYSGLTPGETYTVSGTLMDKETGKSLIVDGSTVTAQTQFTAENSTGVVEVPFTFNSDSLQGKTIVVFEKLLDVNGNVIATHEDIKDKDQTVQVVGLSIRTSATINGQKEVAANGVMDLVDTVTYTGLSPKTEYTLKGTLMDKATGKALDIEGATSEAKFTPDAADGKTTLTFKIDTSKLVGKEIVVFEELYSKDNKKIAEHKDLKDKDQTVKILDISIRTKATIDGQKSVVAGGKKDIVDTVTYKGLTPNKEYTLKGVLMDKETNGALNVTGATSVAKFIPSQADGEATMKFTIDTSKLAGKSIVVFEELYDNNGNKVAEHKDINDADQTVSIQVKGTATTHAPNTGTTIQVGAFLALMIGFLGFAAYMNKKRKDASVK